MASSINTDATEQRRDRDRLVDLHVLAAHGDLDAAARAERWMSEDPNARYMWNTVASTCDELGASSA